MEIKTILWPTDFSKAASAAESFVESLSRKYGAEVHLLHVAEDLAQFERYWGSGPDVKHVYELHKYGMKLARERLEELCRTRLTGCPRYHIHVILGDPATTILKTAKEVGADVVVMATHGMRSLFPFGSVAEKVIRNSHVPVLTVRPQGN